MYIIKEIIKKILILKKFRYILYNYFYLILSLFNYLFSLTLSPLFNKGIIKKIINII